MLISLKALSLRLFTSALLFGVLASVDLAAQASGSDNDSASDKTNTPVGECKNNKKKCCNPETGEVKWIEADEECPEGWIPCGSFIDLRRMEHHHFATDFASAGRSGGGCAPCGADDGSNRNRLPSLTIARHHRYRRIHYTGSFGPGVFADVDSHIRFDITKTNLRLVDMLADADYSLKDGDEDGIYVDNNYATVDHVALLDVNEQPTTDRATARYMLVRTHSGFTALNEIFRENLDPASPQRVTRLVRWSDRNGNSITLDYDFPVDASDADLGGTPTTDPDRSLLWKYHTITDAYGRQAFITYKTDAQVGGRWVIASIDVPVGAGRELISYEYNLNGLGIPEEGAWAITGLSAVNFPDGTRSTFSLSHDPSTQTQVVHFTEAAAEDVHRNKDVHFSLESWTDPVTMVTQAQSGRLIRQIVNGAGELSFLSWDSAYNGDDATYAFNEGKLQRYVDRGGFPVASHYAKTFDLTQPVNTYTFELTEGYTHNSRHQITSRTDALGRKTRYAVAASGANTQSTFPDDSVAMNERNAFRQRTLSVDRLGRVTTHSYDSQGNRLETRRGMALDGNGDPIATADTGTWSWTYTGQGQMATATDANGNVTEYFYSSTGDPTAIDGLGYLVKIIEPADRLGDPRAERLFAYDASGRLSTTTDPEGRVVSYGYDERNRLTLTTYFDGSTEVYTYQTSSSSPDQNLLIGMVDRNGNETIFGYDGHGRRTLISTAVNDPTISVDRVCSFVPGTNGLLASCTDKGETTTFTYDYHNRRISTTVQPKVGTQLISSVAYDDANRVVLQEDRYGRRTYPVYDDLDYIIRSVRETVPGAIDSALSLGGAQPTEAQLLALTRDVNGNAAYLISDTVYNIDRDVIKAIDGRGIVDTYAYDQQARRFETVAAAASYPGTATGTDIQAGIGETAITDPKVARKSVASFDPQGNVMATQSPRFFDPNDSLGFGQATTTMTYTGRNLLASRTVPATEAGDGTAVAAATETFTYYLDRRERTHTDLRGHTWTTHWHACCGRLQAKVEPDGSTRISNTDFNGNVTHTAVVSGGPTTPSDGAPTDQITNGNPPPYPWHDPTDADTVNETTTVYDARNRPIAQTRWLVPLGFVTDHGRPNLANGDIPIADRVTEPLSGAIFTDLRPAADGLTTTWTYDDDLTDGIGLDAAYADYVALLGLGAGSDGYGVATTNPDGEISVSLMDGIGRTVVTIDGEGDARQTVYDQLIAGTPGAPGDLLVTTSIVDPDRAGHTGLQLTASRRRDAAGRILAMVDEENFLSTISYDANGNRLSHRDPNNVGEDCVFDLADRDIICTDTQGDSTFTIFDAASNVVQTVDGVGVAALGGPSGYPVGGVLLPDTTLGTETCVFDSRNRSIRCFDRLNGNNTGSGGQLSLVRYSYDDNDNLLTIEDNDAVAGSTGEITAYTYDPRNLLSDEAFPGHDTAATPGEADYDAYVYGYDAARRLTSRQDQNGDVIMYAYDLANRLLTRGYPDGLDDSFTYDPASRLLTAYSARYDNLVTRTYFDDSTIEDEILAIDGTSYTISHAYDAANRRTQCTYPTGDQLSSTWTDRSQLASCTFASQVIATCVYDPGQREISRTHGNGLITTTSYRFDNLHDAISTSGGVTSFTYSYDANKRKLTETDGIPATAGYSQTFVYDTEDRLDTWSRAGGDGLPTTISQDWTLSLVGDWTDTTRDSLTETRTHNGVHEIDTAQIGAAPVASLAHDSKGNISSNPQRGQGYQWDFDNRLQVAFASASGNGPGDGLLLHWRFDEGPIRVADASDNDHAGMQIGDATQAGTGQIGNAFAFDGAGDRVENTSVAPELNGLAAVTVALWVKAEATNLDRGIFFGRNPTGGDADLGLRYDKQGWGGGGSSVIKASIRTTTGWQQIETLSNTQTTDWQHLALVWAQGQDLTLYIDGVEAATSFELGGIQTGTLSGIDQFRLGQGTKSKHWDGSMDDVRIYDRALTADEITALVSPVQYRYDALARRVQKSGDGIQTTFVCSGAQVFTEYDAGVAARSYVDGMYVDDHLAVIDHTASHAASYYHCNALYSTAAVTDQAGSVVERYGYDAYGKSLALDAAGEDTLNDISTVGNPYRFTGRRQDAETGLQYFRARYYDDELGRFAGRDPLKYVDGFSLYGAYYCPNHLDPSGAARYTFTRICGAFTPGREYSMVMEFSTRDQAYEWLRSLIRQEAAQPDTCSWTISDGGSSDDNDYGDQDSDYDRFYDWYYQERNRGTAWLNGLPPCPCSLKCKCVVWRTRDTAGQTIVCENPAPDTFSMSTTLFRIINWYGDYHPGGSYELRALGADGKTGQQCIYDSNGDLMNDIPAAGSADWRSPEYDIGDHGTADVDPFELARSLGEYYVNLYYEVRPINGGKPCREY